MPARRLLHLCVMLLLLLQPIQMRTASNEVGSGSSPVTTSDPKSPALNRSHAVGKGDAVNSSAGFSGKTARNRTQLTEERTQTTRGEAAVEGTDRTRGVSMSATAASPSGSRHKRLSGPTDQVGLATPAPIVQEAAMVSTTASLVSGADHRPGPDTEHLQDAVPVPVPSATASRQDTQSGADWRPGSVGSSQLSSREERSSDSHDHDHDHEEEEEHEHSMSSDRSWEVFIGGSILANGLGIFLVLLIKGIVFRAKYTRLRKQGRRRRRPPADEAGSQSGSRSTSGSRSGSRSGSKASSARSGSSGGSKNKDSLVASIKNAVMNKTAGNSETKTKTKKRKGSDTKANKK